MRRIERRQREAERRHDWLPAAIPIRRSPERPIEVRPRREQQDVALEGRETERPRQHRERRRGGEVGLGGGDPIPDVEFAVRPGRRTLVRL
jgi:hypothetical protein